MTVLFSLLKLYKHYGLSICLGLVIAIVTLLASLFLLSLSGWFLAASAVAGVLGVTTFNYMLPAVGVRGCAILRTAARYAERLISHNTTFKILSYLRVLSFKKIMPLSPLQMQYYQKADLLNRFIADIDNLDHFYLKLVSPCVAALFGISAIYFGLSYFNDMLALFIASILFLTAVVIPIFFFRLSQTLGHILVNQKNNYRKHLVTYLQGHAELILFSAQPRFREQLDAIEAKWLIQQQKQARLVSVSQSLLIVVIGILTVSVIALALHLDWNYHSPLVALFIFISLAANELLAPLPNAFIYLGQVMASAARIHELFTQIPAIHFPKQGPEALKTPFSIAFDNVTFYYPKQPSAALNEIALTVKANQHIALIGKTGCGKSTLLKLLTRGAEPTLGKITLNGIPLSHFDEKSLRSMMTVVPQRIDILSDTLARNLRIANPKADDAQLIETLHHVGLSKLLEEEELSLWLGDKGRTLSGGEIRRIGIARALLHDAPFIIMDEPTESLDPETERHIVALIRRLCHSKTILMATHRLTDHAMFDCIYHLEGGRIIPRRH